MPKVVAVRLRYAAKHYWFDPNGIEIKNGDHLIVETARGKEMGLCVEAEKEVTEEELVAPLKPVLRVATEEDFKTADSLAKKSEEAFPVFCEMVQKNELDMKPIRVEFVFSGDFATFYFSADERVDFRALVRDLASYFHVRIDMRQIGVRDEARILGGIGHCGEELCCHRFGAEIQQVSIRMAKDQDLPLSSNKISGQCGRLMCCLRYELEAYQDFKNRAPKKGDIIDTPLGQAKVVDFNTPAEIINLVLEDGQSLSVPLHAMDTDGAKKPEDGECVRPCHISQKSLERALEELRNDKKLALMAETNFSDSADLKDVVAENPKAQHSQGKPSAKNSAKTVKTSVPRAAKNGQAKAAKKTVAVAPSKKHEDGRVLRKRRSVSVEKGADEAQSASKPAPKHVEAAHQKQQQTVKQEENDSRKPRRRKRSVGSAGNSSANAQQHNKQHNQQHGKQSNNQNKNGNGGGNSNTSKPRPGQHSSSLSGDRQTRRPPRGV